jgi:hypothetical protein
LQHPLLNSQVGPSKLIQAEAEAILKYGNKCLQDAPDLGRRYGKINVPTVIRKDTGRMNVPDGPGTPKSPPRPEARDRLSWENIIPPAGEPVSGKKTLSGWWAWKATRRNRTDQAPFFWAPRGPSH